MTQPHRPIAGSGMEVSAIGLGCWAIGGPYQRNGEPMGWGVVDDRESIRAVHEALDLGINFFDTADMYGCGHSESVLGQALRGRRGDAVIASKFGYLFDPDTKEVTGRIDLPNGVVAAVDGSLRRLQSDYIDVYQLHIGDCDPGLAQEVQGRLEELAVAGKIRSYGWSSDIAENVGVFRDSPAFTAFQQALNVLQGSRETLVAAERRGLAVICRSPLAMGILTGASFGAGTQPDDDLRSRWRGTAKAVAGMQAATQEIREILQEDGRSLAQGALAWILTVSDATIPIPGFRTAAQVRENAAVLEQSLLSPAQMTQLESLLERDFPDNPWDLRDAE